MIYLDNAATSYPKPQAVVNGMVKCIREYCANPGRGGHSLSLASSKVICEARETISRFFNINNPLRIIFTKNATEALNIAIKGVLKPGEHVITTTMEHNSVIRPLMALKRDRGIEVSFLKSNRNGEIDTGEIEKLIKRNTRLLVSTLSSNVNGIIMPIEEITRICNENGILFLLDASQGAGSISIDVKKLKIDMMAFPGHKGLLGPQGTGGLFIGEGIDLVPLIEGGTGSYSESFFQPEFLPDALESGTVNTPGIVGLLEGIKYIEKKGVDIIRKEKHDLTKRLIEGIVELNEVKIYSTGSYEKNSGIVAVNFKDVDSNEVSYILDKEYNIAVRAGLHCSPMAHKTLGTAKSGVVRFSVSCFNTVEDINLTLEALRKIHSNKKS